jgi:hypothetical protein
MTTEVDERAFIASCMCEEYIALEHMTSPLSESVCEKRLINSLDAFRTHWKGRQKSLPVLISEFLAMYRLMTMSQFPDVYTRNLASSGRTAASSF